VKRKLKVVAIIFLFLLLPFSFPTLSQQTNQERKTPIANKVIIITFDGTRADTFWNTEHWITQHRDEGAWAEKIACTYPTITYPNHVSIVTGTWPQIHKCEMNRGYKEYRHPLILRSYSKPVSEDIFEVAERYGIKTGIFIAPSVLANDIGTQNTYRDGYDGSETDMADLISYIEKNREEIEDSGFLALLHLPDSDDKVHEYSTYSDEYKNAIKAQANMVGDLIGKIVELGWENDTIIFVTADHGALGYRHFNSFPPTVCDVPLWVWGGPVKKGFRLKGGRLIDIGVTVAFALGIPIPSDAVGVVLYRIFREDVLREKRGISNVEDLILSEYRASVYMAYVECVKYLLGFSILVIGLMLVVVDVLKLRKEMRSLIMKFGSKVVG